MRSSIEAVSDSHPGFRNVPHLESWFILAALRFEEKSLKCLYFIPTVIPCSNSKGVNKVGNLEAFKIVSVALRNNPIKF